MKEYKTIGQQVGRRSWAEPWKIKMVEPLHMTSREERQAALDAAGYNTFLLKSRDVYIDLLTDSGTSAMSDRQWSGMFLGDESYAGSVNFYNLANAVKEYYSYDHLIPTHQGRGAEHLLSQIEIKKDQIVPGNMYFTTTRLHQELAGGQFVDVIVDVAHDPEAQLPFKGNVDINKLDKLLNQYGSEKIAYLSVAGTVNMAGGQPVSMQNMKDLRVWCDKNQIKLYLDATRLVENSYFIKEREEGYEDKLIRDILYEFCSLSDGAWMSGKKDHLVNIGGWVAVNDEKLAQRIKNLVVVYEGLHTYGGMAGRDMEAMARGIAESVSYNHIRARVGQVRYLWALLKNWGIPVVEPFGGHAVFLDAGKFYPHLKQIDFPGQTLASELYLDSGVRSMERGIVSAGRDPKTGDHRYPKLELTRLTIPRRVYTEAHINVVAESVKAIYENRNEAKGLEMVYEPEYLRFFQARFKKKS